MQGGGVGHRTLRCKRHPIFVCLGGVVDDDKGEMGLPQHGGL